MDRTKEIYHQLIGINSVSGNEYEIGHYIGSRLEEMGVKAEYFYFDEAKKRPSVIGRIKGQLAGDKTLMLIGHTDTVDPVDGWHTDPFVATEIGDKTYGLGSMDMKGGLTAMIETARYYANNKDKIAGELILAFVPDEEVDSGGTFHILEEGIRADMAIMAEGRSDMTIGFRGRYSIDVVVSGEAVHSQFYPNKGVSAVKRASRLCLELENMPLTAHSSLGKGAYLVKHIEGGYKSPLRVPDKCHMLVERFFIVGETFESIRKEIIDLAEELGYKDHVDVSLRPKSTPYMEPFCVDSDHELVTAMENAYHSVTGQPLKIDYDLSVCDSNILVNVGDIPTVTFGPSGMGLHGPNEFGYFHQVEQCRDIYIRAVEQVLK